MTASTLTTASGIPVADNQNSIAAARDRLTVARRGLGWLIEAGGLAVLAAQAWRLG